MFIVEIWDSDSFLDRHDPDIESRYVEVIVNTKEELDSLTDMLIESQNPYTVSQKW